MSIPCFYQNINGRVLGLNELLSLFDFERELKSRNQIHLPVAITLSLGSDFDCVVIDPGFLIHPERQTHLSDPKGIKLVIECEIFFGERISVGKNCIILNRPVALGVLHEFIYLQSEGRRAHYIVEGLIRLDRLELLHIAFNYHV